MTRTTFYLGDAEPSEVFEEEGRRARAEDIHEMEVLAPAAAAAGSMWRSSS